MIKIKYFPSDLFLAELKKIGINHECDHRSFDWSREEHSPKESKRNSRTK